MLNSALESSTSGVKMPEWNIPPTQKNCMTDQKHETYTHLSSFIIESNNINFHAYTCAFIYCSFFIATSVKGESRSLWVGRLSLYEVVAGSTKA